MSELKWRRGTPEKEGRYVRSNRDVGGSEDSDDRFDHWRCTYGWKFYTGDAFDLYLGPLPTEVEEERKVVCRLCDQERDVKFCGSTCDSQGTCLDRSDCVDYMRSRLDVAIGERDELRAAVRKVVIERTTKADLCNLLTTIDVAAALLPPVSA